jgi:hypothetical protein
LERGETSSSAYVLGDTDLGARMKVAQALDLNERQIRRKLKRYAALHSIDAFLPLRRDPLPGSTSVHPDVERIMTEGIRAGLKLSADIGVDDLLPLIQDAAEGLGVPPPGRSTVGRRLRQARRSTALLPSAIGREIAYRNRPVRSSIETGAPLSVVEIDHTVADVHLIEPQTGSVIGRPVVGRVGGWRADCRLRWLFHRFRGGPQGKSRRDASVKDRLQGRSVRSSVQRSDGGATRADAQEQRSSRLASALRRRAPRRSVHFLQ